MLRFQGPLPDGYLDAPEIELTERIRAAKATLGERVFILGHHYQRDEVMQFADARGDSYRLAVLAQQRPNAEFIVFCGVHFMAESADVLTSSNQQVLLPDLNAGCSMADMANLDDVEEAWESLAEVTDIDRVVPITYMNSAANIKAFVGRHGGAVCTSSNARQILQWSLGVGDGAGRETQGATGGGDKVLFFPDQHLGRNTAHQLGYTEDDMKMWNPRLDLGGLTDAECKEATFLLWRGHCSVHQRFTVANVEDFRAEHPDGLVISHPECAYETCSISDKVGSTSFIIKEVEAAPSGSHIAIGTEIHLVHRLATENPDKHIVSLDPKICPCSTMSRIDAPHLCWVLEELVAGRVQNKITVDPETAEWSRVALQRMIDIT